MAVSESGPVPAENEAAPKPRNGFTGVDGSEAPPGVTVGRTYLSQSRGEWLSGFRAECYRQSRLVIPQELKSKIAAKGSDDGVAEDSVVGQGTVPAAT